MMATSEYDFVFKVLLVGNSSVGKSSLLLRFADKVFHEAFLPTIGVDFKIRTVDHEGSIVKLQMWDTAGQEKFRTITAAYFKGAQGIILVFDICDKKSFEDIQHWMTEVDRHSMRNPIKILVGNKSDREGQRQVSREMAEMFAENEGMIYY
jgi:Ras-related protein Rab-1A